MRSSNNAVICEGGLAILISVSVNNRLERFFGSGSDAFTANDSLLALLLACFSGEIFSWECCLLTGA